MNEQICSAVKNLKILRSREAVINMAFEVSNQWTGSQSHYEPGDHVGVFAVNDRSLVTGLMERLKSNCSTLSSLPDSDDIPLQLQTFDKQQGVVLIKNHAFSLIRIKQMTTIY